MNVQLPLENVFFLFVPSSRICFRRRLSTCRQKEHVFGLSSASPVVPTHSSFGQNQAHPVLDKLYDFIQALVHKIIYLSKFRETKAMRIPIEKPQNPCYNYGIF